MRGTVIKKPLLLPCEHGFSERFFDFDDIKLYRDKGKKYIQCRYKNCKNIFKSTDKIFRIKNL